MTVRLKDIARDLGVSVITASKALRGSKDISDETRKRVLARMREVNYQPNMTARALATGHSSIIGLIVPDLVHPFFAELAKALGGALRRNNYGLILASSEEDPGIEQEEIRMMLARRVGALLIASTRPSLQGIYNVDDLRTPLILVDRNFPQLRVSFVGTDDYAGGQLAGEHLLSLGRSHLAHIGGPDLSPAIDRFLGFQGALRRHGIDLPESHVISVARVEELGDEAGYAVMQQLLRLNPVPDAVFCYNDLTAIGAMQAALDAGFSIPDQIAFLGFGNVRYSKYLRVPLSSIEQSTSELGVKAAELALKLIREPGTLHTTIKLPPRLIVRASSLVEPAPKRRSTSLPSPRKR
jgi:LacI family transcriptional regulator